MYVACLLSALFAGSLLVASARAAEPLLAEKPVLVRAELIADVASVQPGQPFRLGVHLVMRDGWHVNWINPGDAGLAPSIAWKLPEGFKAGVLQWPFPSRIMAGPIAIFGYRGDVLLVSDVQVPANLSPGGNVDIAADVSWLACAEECVPGSASLNLRLPVEAAARSDMEHRALFDATRARLPGHTLEWNVDAHIDDANALVLELQSSGTPAPLEGLLFFPYEPGLIENAAPQILTTHPGPGGQPVYELRITRARMPADELRQAYGLLVASSGFKTGEAAAIEVNVPVGRR